MRTDRPGIALLLVMLVTLAVAAIAAGAALIGANSFLINEYDSRTSLLESVADAGLELGRARLNANPGLFSDTGPVPLEHAAAVYDAAGSPIPGVRRTVYSIPLGGGLGEYGNFAALVAIAEDNEGTRTIRRLDLLQESFASYAYFTDVEPDHVAFGNGDQLYGPVHTNSDLKIRSSGTTFHGPVTTAGSFVGAEYATFLDDTASHVLPILMPTTGQLTRLRDRATPGRMAFSATAGGDAGQSTLRIEFVTRTIDGVETGFVRAYRSSSPAWVTGNVQDSLAGTPNCGHFEKNGRFYPAQSDPRGGHDAAFVLNDATARCFLGGSDELNAETGAPRGKFVADDGRGSWIPWPGPVDSSVAPEDDAAYLFPIDRRINPAFRGVIFVDGKVVVSGTVRGRLTLAATGTIILGDDLVYATDPGAGTCEDMLGLFSGERVLVADNTINAPRIAPGTSTYHSYDDTSDENVHASILALDQFAVQNAASGATAAEACNGVPWGRGCLNLTGGLIQETRGTVAYGTGTGNIKRYTHDSCTFTAPPPYFPSTGHFWRGRYYEVDPAGFDIASYFDALN